MTLQFSIFGYLIMMGFYSITGGFLVLLWNSMRHWPGRKIVIAPLAFIFLALPWADEVYIAWRFHDLCKDAGVHVYKKVKTYGYLDDTYRRPADYAKEIIIKHDQAIKDFDNAGYRFKEIMFDNGKVGHIERVDSGVKTTILAHAVARYVYKYSANNENAGLQMEKTERIVVDSETGEIIGRKTIYKRYPGWIEGIWVRLLGVYPTLCPNPEDTRQPSFPEAVLLPINK